VNCRHCHASLDNIFLDLGSAPPSNAYRTVEQLSGPEISYPLKLLVCDRCWLVQTEDYAAPTELFDSAYAYFSSVSQTWLDHAARYCEMAAKRFSLGPQSLVIEIASNDGYLLRNFVRAKIPCLGVEPTESTAAVAEAQGIPVRRRFFTKAFGEELVREGLAADLIVGNNVFAHVPDVNDFAAGLKTLLKPNGTITLEFPHLMRMIEGVQFDTAYHEHFSYLSLSTVTKIFENTGLRVFDVEELPTHGGSLRVFGCHADNRRETTDAISRLLALEENLGLKSLVTYRDFQSKAERIKDDLLLFLIGETRAGRSVGAYGAAAKGNTLLNFAGVKPDLLPYVCDAAPSKQGKYLPGSHIPILPPSALREYRPATVLVLPWNIIDEVKAQQHAVHSWGGRFAVAIPRLEIQHA